MNIRTDLACEALELCREGGSGAPDIDGISTREYTSHGVAVTCVEVQNESGAAKIGKPVGKYITIRLDELFAKGDGALENTASAIAQELRSLPCFTGDGPVMTVGLGNRMITPDSVGPCCCDMIIATRHLIKKIPEQFGTLRSSVALSPGVLGMTGLETGEIIAGVAEKTAPSLVIAVDALASRSVSRLCRTVQISDTGVTPGSGVGNSRFTISRETLGIPCIAIGVPTVIDAATLAADLAGGAADEERIKRDCGDLFVTLKDIDTAVRDCAKAVAYGINTALQPTLGMEDIEMFLS